MSHDGKVGSAVTDTFNARIDLTDVDPPNINIDPELKKILDEFIADAKSRGVNISKFSIESLRVIKFVDKFTISSGRM